MEIAMSRLPDRLGPQAGEAVPPRQSPLVPVEQLMAEIAQRRDEIYAALNQLKQEYEQRRDQIDQKYEQTHERITRDAQLELGRLSRA
jgi:hypothetical protein